MKSSKDLIVECLAEVDPIDLGILRRYLEKYGFSSWRLILGKLTVSYVPRADYCISETLDDGNYRYMSWDDLHSVGKQ